MDENYAFAYHPDQEVSMYVSIGPIREIWYNPEQDMLAIISWLEDNVVEVNSGGGIFRYPEEALVFSHLELIGDFS